jgi:hypothetical protein
MEVMIFIVLSAGQAASCTRSKLVIFQCYCLERFAHHIYSTALNLDKANFERIGTRS